MPVKKLYRKISVLFGRISALRIPVYAGNATFFLLLSVFPASMLLLTAVQYIPVSIEDLSTFVSTMMPLPVYNLFRAVLYDLEPGKTIAVLSATIIGTVWTFVRSTNTLRIGLEAVWEISKPRTLLLNWTICFLCAVLFFLCIIAMLFLQVFGRVIYNFALSRHWPIMDLIAAILRLRWLFSLAFLTLVFCLFYTILPAGRHNFIRNTPGALFCAVGWLLFSALFSVYVEHFSNYSMIYGSLTAIVVTMLWLYFCLNLLFYGGLFNRFLQSSPQPFRKFWLFLCY